MTKHVKWLGVQPRVVARPQPVRVLKTPACPPGYKLDPRRDKCVPAGTGKKN